MNLYDVDLNLFVVFDAIFIERHLTHAGERLHLSQSAVSRALNRLRGLFGDPLFIRKGNQMVPTPRAEELAESIHDVLKYATLTLEDQGTFDPKRSERTFCLGMNDYYVYLLLPKLMTWLKPIAPNIRIKLRDLTFEQRQEALDEGSIDLLFGITQNFGSSVFQQALFEDREVCIVREGHPMIGKTLNLEDYLASEFVYLAMSEFAEDPIDTCLREEGRRRKIVLSVSHELAIPHLVSQTDYIANIAERLALETMGSLPVRLHPLPHPLKVPQLRIHQYWHERDHHDAGHQWLRRSVKTVCDQVFGE